MKNKFVVVPIFVSCLAIVFVFVMVGGAFAVTTLNGILNKGSAATSTGGSGSGVSIAGTGAAVAASGHTWHKTVMTVFGGPSECQPVAGNFPNTCDMNKNGPFYFATGYNSNTPAELMEPAFKLGNKLIFQYNGKVAIGVYADKGPGATGGGRYIDLGQNLGDYLGINGLATAEWDFLNPLDRLIN